MTEINIPNNSSLIRSTKIQARVIGALLLREIITRYGRHNIGFMWLFVEPMMFSLGILWVWTTFALHTSTLPVVGFALTGYATILCWRNTINRCGAALEPNRALLHHRNVRVIDLYISRIILEITGASMSFILLLVIFVAVGLINQPDDVLKMIVAWLLLAWWSASMAMIIGSLGELSEAIERMSHIFSYLYLGFSGAMFMVDWLPTNLQSAALLIPTVDCTEMLREGLFGSLAHAHYNLTYIIVFNVVLLLPALLLNKYVAMRAEGE